MSVSGTDTLYCLNSQLIRCVLMHTHANPWVHHTCMCGSFQHEHGQIVCRIVSVAVHTTDGKALTAESTSVADCHASFVFELGRVVHLHVLYFNQLKSKFFCDDAVLDVSLVVGIQPLVHTSVGDRVSVSFYLDEGCREVEQLQCLPECLRCSACNLVAVLCDGVELALAALIFLCSCHLFCQNRVALDIFLRRLMHDNHCLVEISLVRVLRVSLA